ncbi:hypothetical protein EBU95_11945 [bacterium]|nr:hypothetical protein [bacterium]
MTLKRFRNFNIHTVNLKNTTKADDFHLETDVFNNFLKFLLRNVREANITFTKFTSGLCDNIDTITSIADYAITYNFRVWNVFLPKAMKTSVDKCLSSDNVHYIVVPIHLNFLDSAHSNVIIIDKNKRLIDFFEPHGIQMGSDYNQIVDIFSIVTYYLKQMFPQLESYTVINAAQRCIVGPQTIQGGNQGHCLAWSLYFIFLRFVNFDIGEGTSLHSSEIINSFLVEQNPDTLDRIIRKFITFVKNIPLEPGSHTESKTLRDFVSPETHLVFSFQSQAEAGIHAALMFKLDKISQWTNDDKWDFIQTVADFQRMFFGTFELIRGIIKTRFIDNLVINSHLFRQSDIEYVLSFVSNESLAVLEQQALSIVNSFFNPHFTAQEFQSSLDQILTLRNFSDYNIFPSYFLDLLMRLYTNYHLPRYQQNIHRLQYLHFLSKDCSSGRGGWLVSELKQLCKTLGLSDKGNKVMLCRRLHLHFQQRLNLFPFFES